MGNQDLKPTRLHCTLKLLESFIDEYFYLNPISQVCHYVLMPGVFHSSITASVFHDKLPTRIKHFSLLST